jgi:hypothetical protein
VVARFLQVVALSALVLAASALPALARPAHHLAGGGTASLSQVAVNVAIDEDGSASGSFECLMAGRSAFALEPFGLAHVMAVHARPVAGGVEGSVATFSGPARLVMDNGQHLDVHVHVWVDAASQRFQLTVDEVGTLPVEDLLTGRLRLD